MKVNQSICVLMSLLFGIAIVSTPKMAAAQDASAKDAPAQQAEKAVTNSEDVDLLYKKTVRDGIQYLLEKGQAEDGSFSSPLSPAVTALCTSALLENKVPVTDERVQKALKFIETQIKDDGGIYAKGSNLRNYETSISMMCFIAANTDGKYDETIQKAVAFLKGIQWTEAKGHSIDSNHYGGLGYGKHKRPDMSNTQYFQDALIKAGVDPKSQEFRNSVIFMSRAQNLSTPHNTAGWAKVVTKEDEGGFIYTPVGEGESKPGKTDAGGLRSYASMTYAGLKSLIYAGIDKDDIRVKAAMDWIGRHYDLTTNPGMGQQGLFYYYHVFAKTLDASQLDVVVDMNGKSHNWRADLVQQLAKSQAKDGSWTNPTEERWFEGDPNLATAYAMLALSYCDQPSKQRNPETTPDAKPPAMMKPAKAKSADQAK